MKVILESITRTGNEGINYLDRVLGPCPHEKKRRKRVNDAPLALRGPLPWGPVPLLFLVNKEFDPNEWPFISTQDLGYSHE